MKVLVLGVTGMLGHTLYKYLFARKEALDLEVRGTLRSPTGLAYFSEGEQAGLQTGVDALDWSGVEAHIQAEAPDVIVNCIGVVKQLDEANDPLVCLPLNSLLPHQLVRAVGDRGRVVHISTDCVFSGDVGNYDETSVSDARDLYGRSKYLGEIAGPGALTLRTSIIGPELANHTGLLEWFLAQRESVSGYTKAVFSGLTTLEISRLIADVVLADTSLEGLYQVAAEPITKYELLRLFASVYARDIDIVPEDSVAIDRSLNGSRFQQRTGYIAPAWPDMIADMKHFSGSEA